MMCCLPYVVIDGPAFSERPSAMTINADHKGSLLSRLAGWWRLRRNPRADGSRPVRVAGDAESAERPANQAKLRVLAGKWPGPADPLGQRLEQLKHGASNTKQNGRPIV
jgi:hypothetical protein